MIDQILGLTQFGAFAFGFIGLAGFVLLAVTYQRNQRSEEDRLKRAKAEIADMTLLFKTMRDIIKQQKSIAREFNGEIDGKMVAVKHLLEQAVQRNERLYDRQQELTAMIRDAKEELSSLQRQARFLREDESAEAGILRQQMAPATRPKEEPPAPRPRVKVVPPEPERTVPEDKLKGTGVTQASFSEWVGVDFQELGGAEPPPATAKVTPPDAPEDPEAAREAFRALLDMDSAPQVNAPELAEQTGSNGSGIRLRKRVMEYSEAGMTVSEIARELGIGKGEVRLALSLANQKHA